MNILVTGAKGFIGKNLVAELYNRGFYNVLEYDQGDSLDLLNDYCEKAEFVFHLAGINRPQNQEEYMKGNFEFTQTLLDMLIEHSNTCPIMFSSSIQATLNNPYGISKKAGEDALLCYGKEMGVRVLIYRFPNVFGKWCRPNYNSVIATFCNNISHNLPIKVNDPSLIINLVYIDDVIEELVNILNKNEYEEFNSVSPIYNVVLEEVVNLIVSFKNIRDNNMIPNMGDDFTKKLYSTYLSYLPENYLNYKLKVNEDDRGSFTEFIKTPDRGQVSINIVKPSVVKGNHWHHTKNEKFLVVSGTGVINLRKYNTEKIIQYYVSSDKLEIIDIPSGYTHSIENLGDKDMVIIIWANEVFDPKKTDTYYLKI